MRYAAFLAVLTFSLHTLPIFVSTMRDLAVSAHWNNPVFCTVIFGSGLCDSASDSFCVATFPFSCSLLNTTLWVFYVSCVRSSAFRTVLICRKLRSVKLSLPYQRSFALLQSLILFRGHCCHHPLRPGR